MGLVNEKPSGMKSGNALDELPDDLLDTPPAYYKLGITPAPIENPLAAEESGTYCVRIVCSGEHGPLVRGDGERRYERSMKIQAIWKMGDPEPPDATSDQPALFGDDGEATDDPEALGDVLDNVSRPSFSNLTGDRDE